MGEPLHCTMCGKPATVHLTQIIGNQVQKLDLCDACAHQKGVTDPQGFSLNDLLTKHLAADLGPALEPVDEEGLICESCGCDVGQMRESGRLGCSHCYERFKPLVKSILKRIHGKTVHCGKVAHKSLGNSSFSKSLKDLEASLHSAIEEERYEDAARYRDEIEDLKTQTAELSS